MLAVILAAILIQSRAATNEPPAEPMVAASTAPDEPSPTPSPSATPSAEPIAIPTPDTAGRDFDRIFREINAFRNWLYANPDPDLVHLMYAASCDCHQNAVEQLSDLREEGLRFDDEGFIVHSVEVVEDFPSLVRLYVTIERTKQVLKNRSGVVVETGDGVPRQVLNVALMKVGPGWMVRTISRIE